MIQKYDYKKFKSFVCYKEKTGEGNLYGNLYAELLKDVLLSIGIEAFVAHIEREKYSEVFDEVREQIILNADYFFFVNSEGAYSSTEVMKEFNMAYSGHLKEKPKLIILRHKPVSPVPLPEFEKVTRLKLGDINQVTFFDEENLIDVICELIKTYGIAPTIPSKEQFRTKLKLIQYLRHCNNLTERKNPIDQKTLGELYVQNNATITSTKMWESDDDLIPFENEEWQYTEFLKSDQKIIVVGAPYGVGKTSFSYKLASEIASKALKNLAHEFIPIHISLKYKLFTIDNKGNTLDDILSLIQNKDSKVLFIYDGLDEYEDYDKIPEIYNNIFERFKEYQKSKAIITSRLITGYPTLLKLDEYVRLRPFTDDQVNQFFNKYGLPLTHKEISESGIAGDEISKPLFCWMIALIYSDLKTIKLSEELRLNRTLLFSTFIHNVIFGKHKSSTAVYGFDPYNLDEKLVLRKTAELKHIYENSLTKKIVLDWLTKLGNGVNSNIIEKFEILMSSYFYNNEERLEFIHKSLVEYLLAEYYIECFLKMQPYRINLKKPSVETVQFFEGLLQLINSDESENSVYTKTIIQSYNLGFNSEKIKSKLLDVANKFFADESVYLNKDEEYGHIHDTYANISYYRWLSLMIINKLGNMAKIDSKKLIKLFESSHGSVPDYMISIDNIDLSGSIFDFESSIPNWNLSKANLAGSKFRGEFNGTKFSGADLSNSVIEQSTRFMNCDFSGANLSGIRNKDESAYAASFIHCNFGDSTLKNCVLSSIDFTYSDFRNTDLSGSNIRNSNFSLTNLGGVSANGVTSMSGIELIGPTAGTDYNTWWKELKSNKDLVNFLLSKMSPELKEIILRDNPILRRNKQT